MLAQQNEFRWNERRTEALSDNDAVSFVFCCNRSIVTRQEGKGKRQTLDIALLSEGTSLQKRSNMARIVEGLHSFTCTPTRLSTTEAGSN